MNIVSIKVVLHILEKQSVHDETSMSEPKIYMLVDERMLGYKKSPEEEIVRQKFARPNDVLKSEKRGERNDETRWKLKDTEKNNKISKTKKSDVARQSNKKNTIEPQMKRQGKSTKWTKW